MPGSGLGSTRSSIRPEGCLLRSRRWLLDLGAVLLLLVLPLILFWSVTAGPKTLIPTDNLYQWESYRTFADEQGVALPPHNELLSDLVLENQVWKKFIAQSLQAGEIPLWNPYLVGGVPCPVHMASLPFYSYGWPVCSCTSLAGCCGWDASLP